MPPPGDGRLQREEVVGQCLDRFADFEQADADGVENQSVGQAAALQWERIASMAAWMSASRWRSRELTARSGPARHARGRRA